MTPTGKKRLLLAMAAMAFTQVMGCQRADEYDLLIVNGTIVDGSGGAPYQGDVGVKGDTIVEIGKLAGASAKKVIDAKGLTVSPGFIDTHSHSDYTLLINGDAQSKIRQGVTTEILGESLSAGPVVGKAVPDTGAYDVKVDWKTLGQYFDRLERDGISVNVASYVGSLQVRLCVLGSETDREPNAEETAEMKALVRQAMEDGAFGVSSALTVPPQTYVSHQQLLDMVAEAKPYGGIYATHLRGGIQPFDGLEESLEIGRKTGVPVENVHLNNTHYKLWGKVSVIRDMIDKARSEGVVATATRYPYIAGQNNLRAIVPPWGLKGSREDMLARLRDPQQRRRMEKDIYGGIPGWFNHYDSMGSWDKVRVAQVKTDKNKPYLGKTIAEIAKLTGRTPTDTVFDLLLDEDGSVPAVYFLMSEEDLKETLKLPWVGIGSDGLALQPDGPLGSGVPHPRSYGTFPRVLGKYVREEKVLTLPQAIRKMTALNAEKLGIEKRGLLSTGMKADITVFNADTVIDNATFDKPHQYPTGIDYVVVNGTVVLDQGQHTGARPGRAIRKNRQS